MDAYIIGTYATPFGKATERSYASLATEAVTGTLADAASPDPARIGMITFGSCALHAWGQPNIGGQIVLQDAVRAGALGRHIAVRNVEGACATGGLAFHAAVMDVLSGTMEMALAIGVDKTLKPTAAETLALFSGGIDQLNPEFWKGHFDAIAQSQGLAFAPSPERVLFVDVYALQAQHHMKRYGYGPEALAQVASKNHNNGALNPKAQYRFTMTPEAVLADRMVVAPFTRAMCCPIGDGAAAVLVASAKAVQTLPAAVRARAIRIDAVALSAGCYRALDEPTLTHHAATRAYAQASLGPDDIDVVELHDATAFCEILQCEMLGLAPPGGGAVLAMSGETQRDGRIAVNASGGLLSKGHPLAATGLSMVGEVVCQLRAEAGARQASGARRGLVQNAGGQMGLEEALGMVAIFSNNN